jgi:hypothetical protein
MLVFFVHIKIDLGFGAIGAPPHSLLNPPLSETQFPPVWHHECPMCWPTQSSPVHVAAAVNNIFVLNLRNGPAMATNTTQCFVNGMGTRWKIFEFGFLHGLGCDCLQYQLASIWYAQAGNVKPALSASQ